MAASKSPTISEVDYPAVSKGKCIGCGWRLFKDIPHRCPEQIRPLVIFNYINSPRVHSSGGLNDNERHRYSVDERYY